MAPAPVEQVLEQIRAAGDGGLTPHQFRAQHLGPGVPLAEVDSTFREAVQQLEALRRENPDLVFSYRVLVKTQHATAAAAEQGGAVSGTTFRAFPSFRSADAFIQKANSGGDAAPAGPAPAMTVQRVTIHPANSSTASGGGSDNNNNISPVMLRLQSRGFNAISLVPKAAAVARESGSDAAARRISKGAYPLMSREQVLKNAGGIDAASCATATAFLGSSMLNSPAILKLNSSSSSSQNSQMLMMGSSSGGSFSAPSSASTSFSDKFQVVLPDSQNSQNNNQLLHTQGSIGLSTPLAQGLNVQQSQQQQPQKKARVDETEVGFTAETNDPPTRPPVEKQEEKEQAEAAAAKAPEQQAAAKKPAGKKAAVVQASLVNQPKLSGFFAKKPVAAAVAAAATEHTQEQQQSSQSQLQAVSPPAGKQKQQEDQSSPVAAAKPSDDAAAATSAEKDKKKELVAADAATTPAQKKKQQEEDVVEVSDDDDEEDNVPFAAIKKKKKEEAEEILAQDDVPFGQLRPKAPATNADSAEKGGKPKAPAATTGKKATKQMTLNFVPIGKVVSNNGAKSNINNKSSDAKHNNDDECNDFVCSTFFDTGVNDEIVMQDEDDDDGQILNGKPKLPADPMTHMMNKARADAATTTTSLSEVDKNKSSSAKAVVAAGSHATPSVMHFFTGAAADMSKQYTRRIKEVMEKKPNGEIVCKDVVVYVNHTTGEEMSKEQYERKYASLVHKSVAHEAEIKEVREAEAARKKAEAEAKRKAAAKKKSDDDDDEGDDGDQENNNDDEDALLEDEKPKKKKPAAKARGKAAAKAAAKGTPTLDGFFKKQ